MIQIETEIDLVADSEQALSRLLRALPFWGWQGDVSNNTVAWRHIWATLTPSQYFVGRLRRSLNDRVAYKLRISGFPHHWQRVTLEEVERALTLAADRLRENNRGQSTSVLNRKQGSRHRVGRVVPDDPASPGTRREERSIAARSH